MRTPPPAGLLIVAGIALFAAAVKADTERMQKVIQAAGLKVE